MYTCLLRTRVPQFEWTDGQVFPAESETMMPSATTFGVIISNWFRWREGWGRNPDHEYPLISPSVFVKLFGDLNHPGLGRISPGIYPIDYGVLRAYLKGTRKPVN